MFFKPVCWKDDSPAVASRGETGSWFELRTKKINWTKNEKIIIWFVWNLTLDVLPAVLDSRRLCVLRIEAGRRRSTWGKSCCIKSVGKIYSVYILKNLPGSSFAISAPSTLAAVSFSSTNSTKEGAPWKAFFLYGNKICFQFFESLPPAFLLCPKRGSLSAFLPGSSISASTLRLADSRSWNYLI